MISKKKADIGLIGLGVMGGNLALNMETAGLNVTVYNHTPDMTDKFMSGRGGGKNITAAYTLEEFADRLEKPRKVFMMIKAGEPVDSVIRLLLPLLEKGDIIIDGGNSNYRDTERRVERLAEAGILFVGAGVSGGAEGALRGPSIMPGGAIDAWPHVKPILEAIAAKADGIPCCGWVGGGGAGHFVKMVHNGIEYGDMQLICEVYQLMCDVLGMGADEIREVFERWNGTELNSYLIEITGNILAHKNTDGAPLVDSILDAAGQKGTGMWTCTAALDEGVPLTLISEAVFARFLSAKKDERAAASMMFPKPQIPFEGDKGLFIECVRKALYASKIISYAQGYELMRTVSAANGWHLDCGSIALMWRGGCIIRSAFLGKIKEAYDENPEIENLILAPHFRDTLTGLLPAWRETAATAIKHGVAAPAMLSALEWFDGYTTGRLSANLLQAQRDYFGAHTYERVDAPRGQFFHTDWMSGSNDD